MAELQIDKTFVRQVLHQAFGSGDRIVEIYAKAWCLRDTELDDWRMLRSHLEGNKLVVEVAPEHFQLTEKGEGVLYSGEEY
jgi:hypothetical protein